MDRIGKEERTSATTGAAPVETSSAAAPTPDAPRLFRDAGVTTMILEELLALSEPGVAGAAPEAPHEQPAPRSTPPAPPATDDVTLHVAPALLPPAPSPPAPAAERLDEPAPREPEDPARAAGRRARPALPSARVLAVVGVLLAVMGLGAVALLRRDAPPAPPTAVVPAEGPALADVARSAMTLMVAQRDSATTAGVSAATSETFAQGERRAQVADSAFARGDEAGLTLAATAAREAADLFVTARLEATASLEALKQRAAQAEQRALAARRVVEGRRADAAIAPLFGRAEEALAAARRARDEGARATSFSADVAKLFEDAAKLFGEAERSFLEAGAFVAQGALQESAMRARAVALRVRDRAVGFIARLPALGRHADWQRAEAAFADGDRQLQQTNYRGAQAAYAQAGQLYERLTAAVSLPPAAPSPASPPPEDAERALRSLAARVERYLEAEDLAGLTQLHSDFARWESLFAVGNDLAANVSISDLDVEGTRASAVVSINVRYRSASNESFEVPQSQRWTMEHTEAGWTLAGVR